MKISEVFPYLIVSNTQAAIEFYSKAFGAREKFRLTEPSGRIGHAEIELGGITLMLADEYPEYNLLSASTIGKTAVSLHLHVDDADAMIDNAVRYGAKLERAPQDMFYGERSGSIFDPFGHRWLIGHSIEELEPVEMQRRYTKLMAS